MDFRRLQELAGITNGRYLNEAPMPPFYHGTSKKALELIRQNSREVQRVYTDSNVSLGGAYLTTRLGIAQVAAKRAASAHGSEPVVIEVEPIFELLPDEDWVVEAAENPRDEDFDHGTEEWLDDRYAGFFDELFSVYDGNSLSDAYARHYDMLNDEYMIEAEDSLKYIGSVRQQEPLAPQQVKAIVDA